MNWIEIVTLVSSLATTVGVFVAAYQIQRTSDLHRIQFEDALAREYRELMQNIPVKALLGSKLSDEEFADARKYLFHYFSLTNDQIFLRSKNRIRADTWRDWQKGVQVNMKLPAFERMWEEIVKGSKNFLELGQVIRQDYKTDPKEWTSEPTEHLLAKGNRNDESV